MPSSAAICSRTRAQGRDVGVIAVAHSGRRAAELSPTFYEAAWELCRRGVMGPAISRLGAHHHSPGHLVLPGKARAFVNWQGQARFPRRGALVGCSAAGSVVRLRRPVTGSNKAG
jgi:hypothetical protein